MNYDSHRWVSLVACTIASMCTGLSYAWSVFQKPLVSLFNWSPADVSLSFTLIMSTAATTAIFAGKALDYIQPRYLILLGGALFGAGIGGMGYISSLSQLYMCAVLAGIGLGTVYPGGTMANMVRFFPDKRGLVSGLLTGGCGVGPVIWAPVSVALVAQFGVLTTLKIIGVALVVIIGVASTVVKTAPDGYRPAGWVPAASVAQAAFGAEKTWQQMLKDPSFYFLACMLTLGYINGMMMIGHASPIAQDLIKLTPQAAAVVVGLLAIFNTSGRVCWGWISDKIGRTPVVVVLFILGGAGMGAMTQVSSYFPFVAVVALLGLCYGGFMALIAPFTADFFGTKNLGVNFGIMFLTVAIAAYVGPLLAAMAKQAYGDYRMAFVVAIFVNIAGLLLFGAFRLYRNRKAAQDKAAQELFPAMENQALK
jgi:OFA family oxalate/formate antiporter-like MFS transporter